MTEPTKSRTKFFDQLHQIFLKKKGQGAFAYISVSQALVLFNSYVESNESADLIINRFITTL